VIPEIGVLLAAYVVTRTLEIATKPMTTASNAVRSGQILTLVFAIATMCVAIFVGIDLLLRGTTGVSLPELSK